MAVLFTQGDDRRMRITLCVIILLGAGAVASPMIWVRSAASTGEGKQVSQPVLFDHRHHVLDAGIDCRYCHSLAFESAVAGVPPTTLCMNCHNQVWTQADALAIVRDHAASGEPIAWQRVHRLPEHVYFNHAAHVRQGVPCATCHGAVETMPNVWKAAPMSMQWCIECHRDPTPRMRPSAFVTDPFYQAADHPDAELAHVAPPEHCSGCHR